MPLHKELRYFNYSAEAGKPPPPDSVTTERAYLALFEAADKAQLIGEATPAYLSNSVALDRIAEQCPKAHIVIMLREPVSRAFSQYLMLRDRYGMRLPDFLELVRQELDAKKSDLSVAHDFITHGEYGRFVPQWIEKFGTDRVGIFLFDDLVKDPSSLTCRVVEFLGLNCQKLTNESSKSYNNPYSVLRRSPFGVLAGNRFSRSFLKSILPRKWLYGGLRALFYRQVEKPKIDHTAAALLADYYRSDLERLEAVLGRRMPELYFRGG